MGRLNDIGTQFDQMAKRARGGRRLDDGGTHGPDYSGTGTASPTQPAPTQPTQTQPAPSQPTRTQPAPSQPGSLKDKLRDILRGKLPTQKPAPSAPTQPTQPTQPAPRRADLPSEATVQIEYSPKIDGDPDPGDVVWVWVPFEEDPTQGKDRPLVVIGRRGSKLVGVPLTTKQNTDEAQVEVGTGDWDPKHRVSFARIWRMMDIDESAMRREGAILDTKRFELIVRAVDQYYEVAYPSPSSSTAQQTPPASTSDDY